MTRDVTREVRRAAQLALWLAAAAASLAAQMAPPAAPPAEGPAAELYRQLRTVGLDPQRVFQVRDATLDRDSIHLVFNDGTIAFTRSVEGLITGAFFEGEGEILVMPPDKVERASLALFTGSPILTERFSTAYLRFNDDTFGQLEPALRASDGPHQFVARWNAAAGSLAEADALRLLVGFLNRDAASGSGRMLHARVSGEKLGTFDVRFDELFAEQVAVGQVGFEEGQLFFNLWTAFPSRAARFASQAREVSSGYAAEANIRVTSFKIRAEVRPPDELEAEAVLLLDVAEPGRRAFGFELSRFLTVRSVTLEGQPLEFIHNPSVRGTDLARRGNDVMVVVLPRPFAAPGKLELRFAYGGKVLADAGGGLFRVGARGTWYPNRGMAMADFDLEFRHPPEWTLVATGRPVSEQRDGNLQVSRWRSDRPMPVAGFNLGRYVKATARAGDTLIETYASRGVESSFPRATVGVIRRPNPRVAGSPEFVPSPRQPDPARNAQVLADRAARTVEFLSQRLGPFPYSQLALTQMPGRDSQGWPGLVFLSSYAFLAPEEQRIARLEGPDAVLFGGLMQAHEAAHQWWGDLVLWRSYRDRWAIEALANYCALLEIERERPGDFRTMMEHYRTDLVRQSSSGAPLADAGPVSLGVRLSSSVFPDGFDVVAYGRGTWLFHMLRHMLRDAGPGRSDELFFRVLENLRRRHENGDLSNHDLQRAFEEVLPPALHFDGQRSLDWFFAEWVHGTVLPALELAEIRLAPRAGKVTATGKILQRDAPDTLITSVPVYAVPGRGKPVLLGRVFADGPETVFRFTAPAGTTKLLLDPLHTVLTRP